MRRPIHRLITRDPASGGELLVTRLESPDSGIVIEGEFSLGWIGRLTSDQLEFVGELLRYRCNVQKMAAEMGMAYNTARSRLDDIVAALGGTAEPRRIDRAGVIARLQTGDIGYEEAMEELRGGGDSP